MSQEKLLIVLVIIFLVSEIVRFAVDNNAGVKKMVESNPFLDFVYKDAVGYVHIFEKTEMPNKQKLEGVIDQVVKDAQGHGYKVTDQDRALIEGAVEYAVNRMHLANEQQAPTSQENTAESAKTVEGMTEQEVNQTVPDAPQLAQVAKNEVDKTNAK